MTRFTILSSEHMTGAGKVGDLDGNDAGDYRVFPVGEYVTGTMSFYSPSGWSSGVVTVERSNDLESWHAMPSAVTVSANGMTAALDVSGVAYLRAVVTTANGSPQRVRVVGCFKSE